MAPLSVLPDSENLDALRRNVREMNDLFEAGPVNFVAFAKCFQGAAAALLATLEENQSSSLRFAAVAKALDLKTPKSKLEAFIHGV
jgi:hypothetical protein